ncbi:hypothetical protein [Hydrogenobacter hydrogenophilus]|uniref:Uncharacterized protein n=1 Tax=Hydrogenobacter hydrogenophilus TaxID=35835 RepID=A0A285NUV2_9AQUI|nr:hypothetical protein [Hydrogenobacter hydrogenophilus]SNZ13272.1 hypothetical protein SAMN06265353_0682 [Hydrogenobacter hydrogenophilus]
MQEEKKEEISLREEIERLEKELKALKEKIGIEEKPIVQVPIEKAREIATSLLDVANRIIRVASAAASGAIEGAKKELEKSKEGQESQKKEQ